MSDNPITYRCAKCGEVVEVRDGKVAERPCAEACEAAVTADLAATAYGESRTAKG